MNRYKTYQFIAQCLVLDYRNDLIEEVKKTINSGSINWERFFKIGSNHLVLQAIYRNFETYGISDSLPPDVFTELQNIYDINKQRNALIITQALEINTILRNIDIKPVFLKGISHLMNEIYKDPGERIMADIDFLVSKEEIQPAVSALENGGYIAPIKLSSELNHIYAKHHPRLYKTDMPAFVEIHWEAVRSEYSRNFTYTDIFARKISSKLFPECFTSSNEDSAIHNFIHSQLDHKGHIFARVYLRNLYDLLLLSSNCNIQECFNPIRHYSKKSASYIHLAERIFKLPLASHKQKEESSKLFLFRHTLNLRFVTLSFLAQLIGRFYVSYIKKFYLFLTDKKIRKLTMKNLSSRKWYKQHFNSYKSIFGLKK